VGRRCLRPSTIRAPDKPPITCGSTLPIGASCQWEWYQYVPGGASSGTLTTYPAVVPAGTVRRTLSDFPEGDTCIPWKWMFVGTLSLFTNVSRRVSPGRSRSVGPGNEPL
jgi:hypothetical protein